MLRTFLRAYRAARRADRRNGDSDVLRSLRVAAHAARAGERARAKAAVTTRDRQDLERAGRFADTLSHGGMSPEATVRANLGRIGVTVGPAPRDTPTLPPAAPSREWVRPTGVPIGTLGNCRAVALIPTEQVDTIVKTLGARVLDVIEVLLPPDTYVTRARYLPERDVFEALVMAHYLPTVDPAVESLRYTIAELEALQERHLATEPHSRACGIHKHDHGPTCHRNCPTCSGKR